MTALTGLLMFVPRRVLWGLLLLSLALLGVDELRVSKARRGESLAVAALQADRAAAARAASDLQASYRKTEQARAARIAEIQRDQQLQLFSSRRDAARAADAVRRLREQLSQVGRSGGPGSADPGPAGGGAAAADLAELLGTCSERYRAVAAAADQHYAAGRACEQSFDAMRDTDP